MFTSKHGQGLYVGTMHVDAFLNICSAKLNPLCLLTAGDWGNLNKEATRAFLFSILLDVGLFVHCSSPCVAVRS